MDPELEPCLAGTVCLSLNLPLEGPREGIAVRLCVGGDPSPCLSVQRPPAQWESRGAGTGGHSLLWGGKLLNGIQGCDRLSELTSIRTLGWIWGTWWLGEWQSLLPCVGGRKGHLPAVRHGRHGNLESQHLPSSGVKAMTGQNPVSREEEPLELLCGDSRPVPYSGVSPGGARERSEVTGTGTATSESARGGSGVGDGDTAVS